MAITITPDGCIYFTNDDAIRLKHALRSDDSLESKLNQAVEDIRMLGRMGKFICPVCAYYNHGEETKGECVKCLTGDGFRWRGEKEDGGAEG